jgi:hypothetical protein
MLLSETTEISDLVWFYNARQWTRIVGGTPLPPAAFNMHGGSMAFTTLVDFPAEIR